MLRVINFCSNETSTESTSKTVGEKKWKQQEKIRLHEKCSQVRVQNKKDLRVIEKLEIGNPYQGIK